MQFENPACAEHPDYPAFITCPLSQIMSILGSIWSSLHGHDMITPIRKFGAGINTDSYENASNHYLWFTIDDDRKKYLHLKDVNFPLECFFSVHKFYLKRFAIFLTETF